MALATQQSHNTQTQTTAQQTAQTPPGVAYRYIAAWTLIIVALMLLNKTAVGHTAIYYTLVLMIVFLLITQFHAIATVLAPLSNIGGGFYGAGALAGGALSAPTQGGH